MNNEDYIITQISTHEYDVWKEGMEEPYHVIMYPRAEQCNCPHWKFRLSPGRKCKHIKMVEEKDPWNLNPIKVHCNKCDEWINETTTGFIDIEEGMLREDILTFICPKCNTRQKSHRMTTT